MKLFLQVSAAKVGQQEAALNDIDQLVLRNQHQFFQ